MREHFLVSINLHRRQRVGCARRPPHLGLGVAGYADLALHGVVVRAQIFIFEGPVEARAVQGAAFEVIDLKSRPHARLVQRCPADPGPRARREVNTVIDIFNMWR